MKIERFEEIKITVNPEPDSLDSYKILRN